MKWLLILLIFLAPRAFAQQQPPGSFERSPFEVRELPTTILAESPQAHVFIRDSNLICYQNTQDNSDTVRIAYKTPGGQWLSFPTPFARKFLRTDFQFADLDHDIQPELIVNGETSVETLPRGDATNYSTIIFKLDRKVKIIFQCTTGCWVSNFGGRYKDNPIDFGIGRLITTDTTGLCVGQLPLSQLKQPNEKNAFKEFCRLTDITSGVYKLENGQFVKQEAKEERQR